MKTEKDNKNKKLEKTEKCFIIFWRRTANSGVIYPVYANNEKEAVEKYGWNTEYVLHTVVEVGDAIPQTIGKKN